MADAERAVVGGKKEKGPNGKAKGGAKTGAAKNPPAAVQQKCKENAVKEKKRPDLTVSF